jgi:membrane-bound inhibitor of C-type lysozyme
VISCKLFVSSYYPVLFSAFALVMACNNGREQYDGVNLTNSPSIQKQPQTYVYECSGTYSFIARIEGEKAWLFLPDQTLDIPKVPSSYGVKYSKGLITFWIKGEETLLETGKITYRNCNNNRAKAIWENAKLNGVDFRATGNEPGWHMEITAGKEIVFVSDYGQSRYDYTTPAPIIDQEKGTTTYKIQHDNKYPLIIVIEDRTCHDSMSGELYEATVTVILGDKKHRGCGKALH